MTVGLQILQAGPSLTVQDFGRIGYLDRGLSRGGAADMLALNEGAALLNQSRDHAALEMAGFGGVFEATGMLRIALTGAPMLTCLDGVALVWNASHRIEAGQKLSIGAPTTGVFGYLSLGGGIDTLPFLGSRSAHLAGGIGRHLIAGDHLPAGTDTAPYDYGNALSVDTRFSGGRIRILPSAQTELFTAAERQRFTETAFIRGSRGNRQGVQLEFNGAPFVATDQLLLLSEVMVVGDVQMTGNGAPFILLPECQTTGGYPRIGTVLPQDVPYVAQATPGCALEFEFVSQKAALESYLSYTQIYQALKSKVVPLLRNPHDIKDLLSYQLISGVTAGYDE